MAAQADEVDGRYLHFENDMQTSFIFLTAVFSVSKSTNQAPLLSPVSERAWFACCSIFTLFKVSKLSFHF